MGAGDRNYWRATGHAGVMPEAVGRPGRNPSASVSSGPKAIKAPAACVAEAQPARQSGARPAVRAVAAGAAAALVLVDAATLPALLARVAGSGAALGALAIGFRHARVDRGRRRPRRGFRLSLGLPLLPEFLAVGALLRRRRLSSAVRVLTPAPLVALAFSLDGAALRRRARRDADRSRRRAGLDAAAPAWWRAAGLDKVAATLPRIVEGIPGAVAPVPRINVGRAWPIGRRRRGDRKPRRCRAAGSG